MKYTYVYKTSDGARHEASMNAPSREAVFEALRAQGIRAIKVVAADGSKANGEVVVRGVRKRVFAISAVILVLCALVASIVSFRAGEHSNSQAFSNSNISPSTPRHQIYGDPAVMAAFEQGDFSGVLDAPGDQLLAWFAQPGKLMCPSNANATVCTDKMASNLLAVAREKVGGESRSTVELSPSDSREVVELKRIVNGMRLELCAYLANGNGTPKSYWRRLIERTRQEAQIYERTRRELEKVTDPAAFEQRNSALRALGLRTIPNPKESE